MSDEMTVYIANMSEDVWPFISSISDKRMFAFEIEDNAHLGDRDIFAVSPNGEILCMLPLPISEEYLSYYKSIMNVSNVRVTVPSKHTGEICEDILRDEAVMDALVGAAGEGKSLTLISYTTSLQFLRLVRVLRERELRYILRSLRKKKMPGSLIFGSKSGIRQFAQKAERWNRICGWRTGCFAWGSMMRRESLRINMSHATVS